MWTSCARWCRGELIGGAGSLGLSGSRGRSSVTNGRLGFRLVQTADTEVDTIPEIEG